MGAADAVVPGAQRRLLRQLQAACSGELAAAYAYRGHWRSLKDPAEREQVRRIEAEEWHHRRLLIEMLAALGSGPRPVRETLFGLVGRLLGAACSIAGWFFPMYGAGWLEKHNVREYQDAARCAHDSGQTQLVACLLEMAAVEWEHERYFRERLTGRAGWRWLPLWPPPEPRDRVRAAFEGPAPAPPASGLLP